MSRKSLYLLVPVLILLTVVGAVTLFKTRRQTPGTLPSTSPGGVELVTVREFGFEPKLIKRPGGPFILRVENRSGRPGIKLSLVNENGASLREIPITMNILNWTEQLDLPAGKYSIQEASQPEWKCRIEIEAK
jgi:hypothetical protein